MKIEMTCDQVDEVVIEECLYTLSLLINPANDPHETFDSKANMISAFCTVLRYYMTEDMYNEEIKKLEEQG